MENIEEVNGRIMRAMERLAQAVDQLSDGAYGEVERLQHALDGEKQVNGELIARVQILEERQEQAITALEAKARDATDRVAALDRELQQLRYANAQLIANCDALREANAEGLSSPDAIDQSLKAELEAIRALRSAEMTEAQEIISALTPLLRASEQTAQTQENSDA